MKKKICVLTVAFSLIFANTLMPVVWAEESEKNKTVEQSENVNDLPENPSENNIEVENNEENLEIPENNLTEENSESELLEEEVEIKNAFVSDESGIKYYDSEGKTVSGEVTINGFLYCFNEEGYLKLGLQENSKGKSFYTDVEPYLNVNKFQNMEEGSRYFDENGLMVHGCKKINSKWYYFDETGVMYHQGWKNDGEKKCYYNEDGTLALGVKKIGSSWYYFKGDGNMHIGWRKEGKNKYYYNTNGTLALGAKRIGSSWYYFKGDGNMHIGWRKEGKNKYYYNTNGTLALGEIGSSWYYFKGDGNMHIGWRKEGKNKYYYNTNGTLALGVKKIGSSWYYFKGDGNMHIGWRTEGKNKYYYNTNGTLALGAKTINGKTYYFNKDGTLAGTTQMSLKAQQYSSKTKWMILVDTKKNRVGVFNGSKGNWVQKKDWICTSGAKATPTVKGQFTVGSKGKVFGHGYSCWYYTQFYGDYLFHSILYNPGSMTSIQDGRLGINASHGCVRLSLNNAKWIYNNIPKGTKVVVY